MEQENPWVELCPGIKRQTSTTGPKMYQQRAKLEAGSRLPEHHHHQDQIAYVISGHVRLVVGGVPHDLKAGQCVYIGSDVPHSAETFEETLIIDTFTPPRDDYLQRDEELRGGS
jgi:quercetin dioxygenase-like cupin family protein